MEGGNLIRIASDREVTRLGKDLLSTGRLNSANIDLSIRSLARFKAKCDDYGVKRIIALGTSALREAEDSGEFLAMANERVGLDIEIISGEKEADLTLKGIRGQKEFISDSPYSVIVDVGGGSTEVILCNDYNSKYSTPIGAVKLHEKFIRSDPPALAEIGNMKAFIVTGLRPLVLQIHNQILDKSLFFIATGGTPTTLAAMHLNMAPYDGDRVHGQRLTYSSIRSLFDKLVSLPVHERRTITGLESERADIIVTGTMIILVLMELLKTNEFFVSDYGLMEGVLFDVLGSE